MYRVRLALDVSLVASPWRPDLLRPQHVFHKRLPASLRVTTKKIPTVYRKESSPGREATRAMRGNHLASLSYALYREASAEAQEHDPCHSLHPLPHPWSG